MSGQLIGNRYRVLRKIGEGGMAVVHIAVDEKLGRDIAIKILKERFENNEDVRVRFQHEARAISAFDHPNILKIYDFSGENSKQLWIVTELIHGRNVAQILETTPSGWLHPIIAASIVREISRALATAHEHGIVHRDVKPENVMITHQGIVKLMDFGIAKIQRITSMTQTGMFMGSPSYMSPEQVRGRDIDQRSDIYSLGVLFYELVTGRLPYTGSSTADIAMKILGGEFSHPKFVMAGIPEDINQCIVQCMELLPDNRPQSVDDVGSKMDRLLQSLGLESSMQELERCFKDPKAYGDRLAKQLRITDVKSAPTVAVSGVSKWNNDAISSPIPRPDINGYKLPEGSQRRDHLLPPRSVAHISKKNQSPDQIAAHLPERRHQQRATELKVNAYPIEGNPPRIKPVFVEQQSGTNAAPHGYIPANQRAVKYPSRFVPSVPRKQAQKVRYIVREDRASSQTTSLFGKILVACLILLSFGIFWLGANRNNAFKTRAIQFIQMKNKKSPNTFSKDNKSNQIINTNPNAPTTSTAATTTSIAATTTTTSPAVIVQQKPEVKSQKDQIQTSRDLAPSNLSTNTSERKHKNDPKKAPPKKSAPDGPRQMAQDPISSIPSMKPVVETTEPDVPEISVPVPAPRKIPEITKKPEPVGKGTIAVISTPAAELFIDGKRLGTTNDQGSSSDWIDLPSGPHKIELKRSGFLNRVESISITNKSRQKFGPYVLQRGESNQIKASNFRLTLSTNLPPVDVLITNLDTKQTQTLILAQSTTSINLEKGLYEVSMTRKGDRKKRRIDFTGSADQLTFSVEFKDPGSH